MISSNFDVRAKENQGIREFYGDDIALLQLEKKVKMSTHARCPWLGQERTLPGREFWGALGVGRLRMDLRDPLLFPPGPSASPAQWRPIWLCGDP